MQASGVPVHSRQASGLGDGLGGAADQVSPGVMVRQAEALANDLNQQATPVNEQVRGLALPGVAHVVLTGDGDSYHAAHAAKMAFETIADVDCDAVSALPFVAYDSGRVRRREPGTTLVVVVSVSGRSERALQAVEHARTLHAPTVAVTVSPGSAITHAADDAVVVALPRLERSPGIRTYQASLLALLLLAIHLGERRGATADGAARRAELGGLAETIAATAEAVAEPAGEVARSIADAPAVVVIGSGPSYGTAMYAAAKLAEGAGVLGVAQDVEEWFHVESRARPADTPTFVIAPPGRSRWRASQLVERAASLGRRVVAVAPAADEELAASAWRTLPVAAADVPEELSALVYHVFASYVASALAETLGRHPFQLA